MNRNRLKRLIFMALCCDLGVFAKKLIVPAANFITDSLHIPGGIGTSFSLMFIVVAAVFVPRFGSATLMGAVQSGIALCMGTVGSMGALAPLGYILPGFVIDCILWLTRKARLSRDESLIIANAAAAVTACLVANLIVFNLHGIILLLYASVSLLSGTVCGVIAGSVAQKLEPIFGKDEECEKARTHRHSGAYTADRSSCGHSSDNAHA